MASLKVHISIKQHFKSSLVEKCHENTTTSASVLLHVYFKLRYGLLLTLNIINLVFIFFTYHL